MRKNVIRQLEEDANLQRQRYGIEQEVPKMMDLSILLARRRDSKNQQGEEDGLVAAMTADGILDVNKLIKAKLQPSEIKKVMSSFIIYFQVLSLKMMTKCILHHFTELVQ